MREHCHWTGHVSLHGGQKAMLAQIATEGKLQGLVQELERLRAFVEAAAVEGTAADEVERQVWGGVLVFGRQPPGGFFRPAGRGGAPWGPRSTCPLAAASTDSPSCTLAPTARSSASSSFSARCTARGRGKRSNWHRWTRD